MSPSSGKRLRVFFLRHGQAGKRSEWTGDDRLRPLTADGRAALDKLAALLKSLGLRCDLIVTSPLARARETADIVAAALGVNEAILEDERLAHGFNRKALARLIADHADVTAVMVVGHEPEFSATIGELTGGRVVCKKGSLARVDISDPGSMRGELVWLIQPGTLSSIEDA